MTPPVEFKFVRGTQIALHDLGRDGYQHLGVPPGGAMDRTSAVVANRLVGNADDAAVLEFTLIGPSIEIGGNCQIAITGADMAPRLDDRPIPMWTTISVSAGQRLDLSAARVGCRTYMAAGGNWQARNWLGSCSPVHRELAYLTPDSVLQAGSRLWLEPRTETSQRQYPSQRRPNWERPLTVSICPGPEFDQFSAQQRLCLASEFFTVAAMSDRMGIRLEQALPEADGLPTLISSGTVPGTIQIPASGRPVILMRDAQTTGGYPRLAQVAWSDLDALAQLRPGEPLRLKWLPTVT